MKQYRSIQKRRQKSHEKKIREVRLCSGPITVLATPPFGESSKIALLGANGKPPVERVVADLDNGTYRQPHEPVYGHLSGQTQTENQTYE